MGKVFTGDGKAALTADTAMGITTGAPIPLNAGAVVPYENVTVRDEVIFVPRVIAPGDCIFPPAEDVRYGETLLERGSVLRPATMGLLAFVGRSRVHVHRRPRVHILCTGSELVNPWETPALGQSDIRSVRRTRGEPWEVESRLRIEPANSVGVIVDQVATHFEPYRRVDYISHFGGVTMVS